jgi:hypothetical protein
MSAIKHEIERAIRQELISQNENGRRARQALSAVIWMFTLIAGAALGAYFPTIIDYLIKLF